MEPSPGPDYHSQWFPQTKLQAPRLREDIIARDHLVGWLERELSSHPLTLICAPAGYGKTTLLVSLRVSFPNLHLAWLSLDEDDNDPARFLFALVAALQTLNPDCGATMLALLSNPGNREIDPRRVMGVLINDVLQWMPHPFALVLDDVHRVTEPRIYALLDYLIERLPAPMHLVATTRHDPPLALARLRARGGLAEFRLRELRFNREEASQFLIDKLHLTLSSEDLDALHTRAEGWAAGLRLLAGSLDHIFSAEERTAFIQNLVHTDRYVFDFLADEVLRRQETDTRAFLLETSILPELTPPLCQAVTGRGDAHAVLETLYRRNLFLVQLAEAGQVFRYHALFAEFLREQLRRVMPDRIAELHRRAAQAQRTNRPERALAHYLAAEMWDEAAELVQEIGEPALQQGHLESLAGWIQALPPFVVETRPRLSYWMGVCELRKRKLPSAMLYLEQARSGFDLAGDERGQGETLAYLAHIAFLEADYRRGHALIERALTCPVSSRLRVQLLVERANMSHFQAQYENITANIEQAFQLCQDSGDLAALEALLTGFAPGLFALPGLLDRFEQVVREGSLRLGDAAVPMRVTLDEQWAVIHSYRGRLDAALQAGESALALSERLGGWSPWPYWVTAVGMATLRVARGETVPMAPMIQALLNQTDLSITTIDGLLYWLAHGSWLQSDVESARRIYYRLQKAESTLFLPMILAMHNGIIQIADRQFPAAVRTFREAVDLESRVGMFNLFGSARILLAHAFLLMEREQDALNETVQALSEVERQGAPGRILIEGRTAIPLLRRAVENKIHVGLATRLLSELRADADDSAPRPIQLQTGETLTSREVQVLGLIASGASNRDIAKQLVISEHTVKVHVTNILAKLRASSRTQAAAQARELGLLR